MNGRTPVLVGVGQVTNRRERTVEALDLAEEASLRALGDAGGAIASRVDTVWVVNIISHPYAAPATDLGERLSLRPGSRATTTIGGNTPQLLMGAACDAIARGEADVVLIAGAEAGDSARRAAPTAGTGRVAAAEDVLGDSRMGVGPAELSVGVAAPSHLYPLFESAIAARSGRTPGEQQQWLGQLLAPMSEIAAAHEAAWFPNAYTPDEIATPSADNRMIAEPYTKRMNSIIQVDQGAALVVAAAEVADAAGVARDRWVFPWSSASCNDVFLPSERADLSRSPGIEAAGRAALGAAGIGIDDVGLADLYSCFPCAYEMSAEALGLDPRGGPYTVTGSMPYFGGAGNNYVAHAIATLAGRLRQDPAIIGLIHGLGWYVTKHSIGIYSATPPPNGWQHPDCAGEQARIDASALEVATSAQGTATVEAMTVIHDRARGPIAAPVFARLPDGRRVVAAAADPGAPVALSGESLVGRTVSVRSGDGSVVYEVD